MMKIANRHKGLLALSLSMLIAAGSAVYAQAQAPVPLTAYVDQHGFLNMQGLTCAELANTYQEDADALAAWYTGWYDGLAKKHFAHFTRVKSDEHRLIGYCKEHQDVKIINALDSIFQQEMAERMRVEN